MKLENWVLEPYKVFLTDSVLFARAYFILGLIRSEGLNSRLSKKDLDILRVIYLRVYQYGLLVFGENTSRFLKNDLFIIFIL
jgi:hypothetical protein